MLRAILYLVIALSLGGCSTPTIVYGPSPVRPLGDLLPSRDPVRLVFLHGIGDHCSGYALDPTTGWLSDETLPSIGMRRVPGSRQKLRHIPVSVFMPGASPSGHSEVEYQIESFVFTPPGSAREIPVEAIEITWSTLTQWIKSDQLGYDSPSTLPSERSSGDCPQGQDPAIPDTKEAPSRVALNRLIKEDILDRKLADAVLYAGTYQATLERGTAEALCEAVSPTQPGKKCIWPTKPEMEQANPSYVFVTHSLGSRLVYDMFLHLYGYSTKARPNPFDCGERQQASEFVKRTLAHTAALYMMANQLSMLGLANTPPTANSDTGVHPWAETLNLSVPGAQIAGAAAAADACKRDAATLVAHAAGTSHALALFGQVRGNAKQQLGEARDRLTVVSFNDTDDVLTWHIPPWYANDAAGDGRPDIELSNIFVQNSARFIVFENPAAAHDKYFRSKDVWQIIACGASATEVNSCVR